MSSQKTAPDSGRFSNVSQRVRFSFYLYRRASKGSMRLACLAGKSPVKSPTTDPNATTTKINQAGVEKRLTFVPPKRVAMKLRRELHTLPPNHPKSTPTKLPRKPMRVASTINIREILDFEAPIDRIMPISSVRSRRAIVMVLNIPIAETKRATSPNAMRIICIALNTLFAWLMVSEMEETAKPSARILSRMGVV